MTTKADQVWEPFLLNNNTHMPAVGLGTFKLRKEENVMRAVDAALATGYRLFDTSAMYGNEAYINKAFKELLPKHGLEREELFITGKLGQGEMYSKKTVIKAYKNTCSHLGTEYLDLYLIHFPGVPQMAPTNPKHKLYRNIAWSAMTELYDDNLVNAIGVSNFTVNHLKDLMNENSMTPAINQLEWHPYFHDNNLLKLCNQHDIRLQGYSSLGGVNSNGVVLQDPKVKAIAEELGITPAQVLLTWSLQNNVAVIPKSSDPERISENYMFDAKLNNAQMKTLNKLKTDKKFASNPYPFH